MRNFPGQGLDLSRSRDLYSEASAVPNPSPNPLLRAGMEPRPLKLPELLQCNSFSAPPFFFLKRLHLWHMEASPG